MGKQYTDEEKTAARSRLDSTVVRFRRDIEIEIERAAEILGHDVEELRREYSGGIQTGVSLLRKLKTQTDGAHLLRGWFARKSVTLWVAGYGSAKTWLAHRLAWNVAQGLPFLEIHPPHPLNVLYVDMESPDFMKEELLEYMPPGKAPRLHHVHLDEKAARECIHTPGYDLIVVDNLQSNRPLMFKENDQMQAHLQARAYQSIARANNCAVLLLFNTGKKIYKEKDDGDFVEWLISRYKGRGASELEDAVDEVVNMYPLPGDAPGGGKCQYTYAAIPKGRLGRKGDYYKIRWLDEADYQVVEHYNLLGNKQDQLATTALEFIPQGKEMEFSELRTLLGIGSQSSDDKAMQRGLKALTAETPEKVSPATPLLKVGPGRIRRG